MALKLEREELTAPSVPQVETQTIDPAQAALMLTHELYPGQRHLREWHVSELALAIARRQFKPGAIEVAKVGRKTFVVDGQHRLHAVVKSGMPQTFVVMTYHFETEEEVATHYARTDVGLKRAARDMPTYHAWAETHGITERERTSAVSTTTPLLRGFVRASGDQVPLSNEERLRILNDFAPQFKSYYEIVRGAQRPIKRYLYFGGVVAVGVITMRDQKEKARPFWERVAAISGYEEGGGEAYLVGFFLEKGMKRLQYEQTSRYVARAWNTYFEDNRLRVYRDVDPTAPIRIAGTIYDGKSVRTL
jgi:hypothetical protein